MRPHNPGMTEQLNRICQQRVKMDKPENKQPTKE